MFRHLVNIGLLLCFTTLAITGVCSFVLPFEITTTRIHIVFGLMTTIFVGLHLCSRLRYFVTLFSTSRSRAQTRDKVIGIGSMLLAWIALLYASIADQPPVPLLISQGYEARHQKEIFRANPQASFQRRENVLKTVREGQSPDIGIVCEVEIAPQASKAPGAIAIWAESQTGSLIETFYLSESLAYSDFPVWAGQKTPRHHILPIWRHRYTLVNGVEPVDDPAQKVDAYTGATENHSFSIDSRLTNDQQPFLIYVEINFPQDPNPTYDDPLLGQPSLLYSAYIDPSATQPWSILELIGHAGGAREDGEIRYDLENITTARDNLEKVLVKVTRLDSSATLDPR